MRLGEEHLFVLDALRRSGPEAKLETVIRSLGLWAAPRAGLYSPHKVFAVLDQLQTIKMVEAIWPIQRSGPTAWTLTPRGLQCLQQHHA